MAERRVQIGILLPTRGAMLWGRKAPDFGLLLDLAVRAEELGFDSLFAGDSILARPRFEALSVLSAIAARTQKVRLGTTVLLPCLRHPVALAHQGATLDIISGGRVILGVGIGPTKALGEEHVQEFETLGVPHRKRAFYMEELMTLMRRLWTEDNVTFEGKYYRCENVTLEPKPIQRPIPMWIGSSLNETGLRRVARFGDGWLPNRLSPETFKATWNAIQVEARGAGRDAGTPALYYTTCLDDDRERAIRNMDDFFLDYYNHIRFWDDDIEKWGVCGPAEGVANSLNAYIAHGVRHISVRFTHRDQMSQLERFAREVLPHLHLA